MTAPIRFYYSPRTRSITTLWLLEELGVEYELEAFSVNTGRQRSPEYKAMNPMGKVPMVVHDGVPIAELGAITAYLADRYPKAGLAPSIDSPDRGPYLRWLFYVAGVIEPAYAQKLLKIEAPAASMGWGSYELMLEAVINDVQKNTFLLGDAFSAADVNVASTLRFGVMFGALPKDGPIAEYVARATDRDAFRRAEAIEAEQVVALGMG